MVAPDNLQPPISNLPISQSPISCALCGLPAPRHLTQTIAGQDLTFCCYGCQHIYEIIAPDLAQGVDVRQAMAQANLDLNAPCCRGVIQGDPREVARNLLSRLMLNAFLAMMVMVLSLALYSDFFFATWGVQGQAIRSFLQTITMLFATPAVLMLALPILEDAIFTFQVYRQLTTSALIAVGSLAAYSVSVYATFTGQGHTYFETATMTLLLVTLGRWLDAKAQVESSQAVDDLLARAPAEAQVLTATGDEISTPVEQLQVGNHLRVRPGDSFAVDGRIISGESNINEATITGEATPVSKGPNDPIYAGTINLDGSVVVEASQVGEARIMGQIIRLLDEARLHRAPIERLADRVAAYFVPIVMVLALSTFLFWTWQDGFTRGLLNSLAVLLIACPCALGIATPLTIWAGLGRAAQAGVLIRDSLTLEKLSRLRSVFFDKTGTLTTGQSDLVEIVLAGNVRCNQTLTEFASCGRSLTEFASCGRSLTEFASCGRSLTEFASCGRSLTEFASCGRSLTEPQGFLQLVASLEHHSEHPLARSVGLAATQQNIPLLPVENFRAIPGQGISGRVGEQAVVVGNWRLVAQQRLRLDSDLQKAQQRLEQQGLGLVYAGWGQKVRGILAFREKIRPAAAAVLADMQGQGLHLQVLTGDSAIAGDLLQQRLGVPVQSGLLPQHKMTLIEGAEAQGPVAMVGDGLNDAPALARASVGIALGCGADVTREAADVSLLGSDLNQISWTLALARRIYRTIAWNLGWAFVYNVVGIALAMAGLLHPVLAAVAMVLSSALVVGNSLRIFRFKN